jgi:hypothetical protein
MRKIIETKFNNFVKLNMIKEEHESVVLYHGSNVEFNEFDEAKLSTGEGGDLFGKGFYLTNNIAVAKFYAHQITKKEKIKDYKPTGFFKSYEPVYHDDAEEHAEANAKINVFKVEGNFLNCQTYLIDSELRETIIDAYIKHSGWGEEGRTIAERTLNYIRNNKNRVEAFRGELEYVIRQLVLGVGEMLDEIMAYVRNMGFDGIKYESDKSYEGEGSWNYVIFNKKAIKSSKQL